MRKMLIIYFLLGILILSLFSCSSIARKFIFFPQPISEERLLKIKNDYKNVEDITIQTKDNHILHGWLVKNVSNRDVPLIIYFGGNAEEVSFNIDEIYNKYDFNFAFFNYRGFGNSTGTPQEKYLFEDSILIYDYFTKRNDIKISDISTIGRSLGSGISVYLAANRNIKNLILITPYDSIENVAKERFPSIIVNLVLKDKFNSLEYIKGVKSHVLVLAAENDSVIPPIHAAKLYENIPGKKKYILIYNLNHNDFGLGYIFNNFIVNFFNENH